MRRAQGRPRRRLRELLVVLCVVALAGCSGPTPERLVRIVSAVPTGTVPPDAVAVEVVFSAPVDPVGLLDGRFFALCRREDLRAVAQAAEGAAGVGPDAATLPSRVEVEDGGLRVVLRPLAPLEPRRPWAAVLSARLRAADGRPVVDPDGKHRTFAILFDTGAAVDRQPPLPRWIVPPHGPAPANLRAIRIGFSEAVEGVPALSGAAGPVRPVVLGADRLGLELGAPLARGPLAVGLDGVRDAAGNRSEPLAPLEVSRCADTSPPVVDGASAAVHGGELRLEVSAALDELASLGAELSALPGEEACGAAPAAPAALEIWSDPLPCPGWNPCSPGGARCRGRVEAVGLCPGRTLRLRLLAEDLAGNRAPAGPWREVVTLPPRPRPVLTEVLVRAEAPQSGGEYVEVANVGTGEAWLEGWMLAKRGPSGAFARCTMTRLSGGPVPAGGHALVVGGAWDGRHGIPEGTPLYRCGSSALAGGIADDRPPALQLEDPAGAPMSSIGIAEAAPLCAGGVVERIHPGGPDAAANLACPDATTPGACNLSTPPEECPRRPW